VGFLREPNKALHLSRHPPGLPTRRLLVLRPPGHLLAGEARGRCYILLHGKICEKGPHFLLPHLGGVGLVVEQDEPFDPLNIRRNRPGTVITGTHGPFYLLKQFGLGMISRIFPVHVIGSISKLALSIQVILFQCLLLDYSEVGITFRQWVQTQYQVVAAWNVSL